MIETNPCDTLRLDFQIISRMVHKRSKLLDVGCGDGTLLSYLTCQNEIDGRGLELNSELVTKTMASGLMVMQGNANEDLIDYPDQAFDYAVLSHTLQAMTNPKKTLSELTRIANKVIVSFPNFGYWRVGVSLLLKGRMPVTKRLPYSWWNTPNIHLCTIRDFVDLCGDLDLHIEKAIAINSKGKTRPVCPYLNRTNYFSEQAVFLIHKETKDEQVS